MYNKWGDEQKLQPLGGALEEIMGNDKLSEKQRNWLIRFVAVWDYAQGKEENLKHRMNLKSYFNAKGGDRS